MTSLFGGCGTEDGRIAPAHAPGDMDGDRRAMTPPGLLGAWLRRLRSPAFRPGPSRPGGAPRRGLLPVALPCLSFATVLAGAAAAQEVSLSESRYGVWEGNSVVIGVSIDNPKPTAFTLDYTLSGGTASGADVAGGFGTRSITVPENARTASISIATVQDSIRDEGTETFSVQLSTSEPGIVFGRGTAEVSISDDDMTPTLTFESASSSVDEGAGTHHVTVRLSPAPTTRARLVIEYALHHPRVRDLQDGSTATPGSDYVIPHSSSYTYSKLSGIDVPAGATTVTVPVTIVDDSDPEGDETVVLRWHGYGIIHERDDRGHHFTRRLAPHGSHTLTIVDNDPAASFALASQSAGEGAGTRNVEVRLSPASTTDVTFTYTVGGTATAGSDFTIANSGTVTVLAGATTALIPVTLIDDTAGEGNETVVLKLVGNSGYGVGSPGTHTLTIVNDDDEPTVSFASAWQGVGEDSGTHNVGVTLDKALTSDLTVKYTVGGMATAGSDFTIANSGTVTVPKGATTAVIPVTIIDDSAQEGSETVVLTLTGNAGYKVGSPGTHTLTIGANDEPMVSFAEWGLQELEWSGTHDVKLTLDPAPAGDITLTYKVSGTATPDEDYTALPGTLVVPAGATTAVIPVTIIDDTHEDNGESVVLTLVEGPGYKVRSDRIEHFRMFRLHILNDDVDEPAVTIAAGTSPVTEGGNAVFTLTADPAPAADLSVTVAVAADGDYGIAAGERTVTIPASGSATLTLATTGDDADEPHGSVSVTVKDGDGYTVGASASGSITIQDDDAPALAEPAVSVAAGTSPVTEGGSAAFTLTATPPPAADLAVSVTVATDGDYGIAAGSRTVTIPTTGSVTLTLPTTGDDADEPDGSVTVTVTDGDGYTVGSSASGSVTVQDDDAPPPPDGTALPGTVAAALSNGVVTLARPSGWTGSGKIQFGGGSKARDRGRFTTLRIENANDDRFEVTWASRDPGTLRLTLEWQPVAGAFWRPSDGGARDPRVLTIEDPAPAQPVVTVTGGGAVTEGAGAGFTVRRTGDTSAALAVKLAVSEDGTGGRDFVAAGDEGDKEVVIGAGSAQATYTVPTGADGTDEPDGEVTLRLRADNAYITGSPSSATVAVRDDDGAALPEVTVTAGGAVTEGGSASFTLTADPAPAAPLSVRVTVATAGDWGVTAGTQTVTIDTTGSAVLTLSTTGDNTDEPDGSVSVTVNDDAGYTVGDPASDTVAIRDDDVPAVTVSGGAAVTEGGNAVFTLTATPAPAAALTVTVAVATDGAYGITAGTQTVTVPTTGSATLTLTTTDDATDEPDGSVSVTVEDGSGYTVGTPASDTVALRDDDLPPPVVTIAAKAASVTEGGDAVFTLTADRAPAAALTVELAVSETGAGDHVAAADEGPATLVIPKDATEATFSVATVNDAVDEPDGTATVTVQPGEGYTVGAPASGTVTVADDDTTSLPVLSVADVTAREGVDWLVAFTVRLSAPSAEAVEVRVDTRPSTPVSAEPGPDYFPRPVGGHRLVFRAGETEKPVRVLVLDDSHDEEAETFEFVLSDAKGATIGDGVAVGTIVNDDPMPAAWLGRFGRTVAEQALDGIAHRMAAPRTAGMRGVLAGRALDLDAPGGGAPGAWSGAGPGAGDATTGTPALGGTGALALAGVARGFSSHPGHSGHSGIDDGFGHDAAGFGTSSPPPAQSLTLREALLGSRFTLTGEADGTGGSAAFWGRASQRSFDGAEGTFSLDGEATTALLGADYARGRWLIGLALAQSVGEGDYRDTKVAPRPASQTCPDNAGPRCDDAVREGDGRVEASLTAALPYASVQASERLKLWGAAGYGAGEVTLETALGGRYTADTTWRMAAAGVRGDLLGAPAEDSGPALALTSDALWTRTASEETRDLAASDSGAARLRLGVEGSYHVALDGGGTLLPKLELGARHDGGDAETGFGLELGGGLAWSDPALGLTLDVSGRTLLAHEDDDLKDRGFAASLGFDPDPATARGLSFALRQEFGARAGGGLDALFAPDPLEDRTGGEATSRWTMEAAYGVPAFGGRFTASPHVGLGLSAAARDYSLGWRWTTEAAPTPDLSFGFRATRRESDTAAPEHTVGFEIRATW